MYKLGRGCEWGLLHFPGSAKPCTPPHLELVVRPLEPGARDFSAVIASWCVDFRLTASRFPAPFGSLSLSNLAQLPQFTDSREVEGFQIYP